jgi:ferric-dicitrate binding protein FerR (iron transport regulator)
MKTENYHIVRLIQKTLTGEIEEHEQRELMAWVERSAANRTFFDRVVSGEGVAERERFFRQVDKRRRLAEFDARIQYRRRRASRPARAWRRVAVAAAVVLVALIAWQAWPAREEAPAIVTAIKPGSTRATLTLSSGISIDFQPGDNQVIATSAHVQVESTGDGIVYVTRGNEPGPRQINRLKTPPGGEYRVTLPDGTVVHLNASTELEYPVPFDPDKREARLSGEAYFEVARESERPFHVIVEGARVQVHGTVLVVNTRKGDLIQTVLVEGSVGILGDGAAGEVMMTPGQLALFSRAGELVELKTVKTFPYYAWKEGKLIFEEEELEAIMETLALWYDVEVEYRDNTARHHLFTGYLRKYDDIETILNAITRIAGVEFKINGRVITVMD